MKRWAVVVLTIVGAAVVGPVTALACSVCGGNAIGTDPGAGFNSSILFLLSMPYAVFGVIAGWLIYRYWRGSGHRRKSTPIPYPASIEKQSGS
ncbi:MAG: hypothetical protein ACE5K9_06120 [Candidatus Methylomirabilales bacterium]